MATSHANGSIHGVDMSKDTVMVGSDSEDRTLGDTELEAGHAEPWEKSDTPQAHSGPPADEVPDGGTAAWLVLIGAWCCSFCSFGWINSIGVFQEYYARGPLREYSNSTIAWIPSMQIFFMMATGPVVGKIFDKYGPRYLILGGSFLHVFGLMMASLSTEYYQIMLSQGVCSAIGVAAIFQPAISCLMGWFKKRRGMAYGVVATGSSLGGVIFPIALTRIIASLGYGWAMRISAFMLLGLLIVANLTVRTRLPPSPSKLTRAAMAKPFHEPGFVALTVGMFLLTFGIYVPINYLPSRAAAQGIDPAIVQYLVSMLNAASLFGRLSSGVVADYIGKFNSFCLSCLFAAVFTLGLWTTASTQSAVIAYAVIFGFFSGAYVSLLGALIAQTSPLPEIGYRTGVVFLFSALPGLATSPIAGAILSGTGSWINLMVFSGVFTIAGTAVVFMTRIMEVGWKLTAVF